MILDLSSGQTWVMVLNLVIAAFLGGLIGLEREAGHRPAGLRTTMLVCVGSALFTVLSIHAFPSAGDVSNARVAAQIVAGIGFLGAGTVWRVRGSSQGSHDCGQLVGRRGHRHGGWRRVWHTGAGRYFNHPLHPEPDAARGAPIFPPRWRASARLTRDLPDSGRGVECRVSVSGVR